MSNAGKTVTLYKNGDPKLIETHSVVALKEYSEVPATNSASNKFEITDISVVFRPIDRLTLWERLLSNSTRRNSKRLKYKMVPPQIKVMRVNRDGVK